MSKYKIRDLSLVNKGEKIGSIFNEVKEFLESKELLQKLEDDSGITLENIEIEQQGSYSRHTASYIKDIDEKSDVDLIFFISNFWSPSTDQKGMSYQEEEILSQEAKWKLGRIFYKSNMIKELSEFVNLKRILFEELKANFPNHTIKNNNKAISIDWYEDQKLICSIDIAVATYWNANFEDDENYGRNVITNNEPFEIKSLPGLNKINLEAKAKSCEHLYEYIRVIKNINKLSEANQSSYIIECLVYNLDNNLFYSFPSKDSLLELLNQMKNYYVKKFDDNKELIEINGHIIFNSKLNKNQFTSWTDEIRSFVNKNIE